LRIKLKYFVALHNISRGQLLINIMTTFQDLPQHIQEYVHGFNPEHKPSLNRVHNQLIRKLTHRCAYEYCEEIIPIGEEIKETLYFHPDYHREPQTFHFCNEKCRSAGMYWIEDDFRKLFRSLHRSTPYTH